MDAHHARALRTVMRLTQVELAKAMALSEPTVKEWERPGGTMKECHQRHLALLYWRWERDPAVLRVLIDEGENSDAAKRVELGG